MSPQIVPDSHVRTFLQLSRMGINLLVGAATLMGFYLKAGSLPVDSVAVTLGALLLATGCSILNQVQEVDRDRMMARTMNRPIAAGRVSRGTGLILSLLAWALAGLLFRIPAEPALFGLMTATILLYNGIYTPLKTVTPFTLLIGAVMGAFPPMFGWVAAGGSLLDREILILAVVFYLWQTPHFWLLVNRYRDDYLRAGFPQVFQSMPESRYRVLILLWVLAYFVSILLIPLFLPMHAPTRLILIILPVILMVVGIVKRHSRRILFPLLNGSILLVIIILMLDRMFR